MTTSAHLHKQGPCTMQNKCPSGWHSQTAVMGRDCLQMIYIFYDMEIVVSIYSIFIYRVSSKTVCTPILLFSRVPEHIQKNFWPFFNSPGDEDFKTHLTFLPMWKIDLVTEPNVRQTGFWKYHFNGRFCFFFEGVANFRVNYLSHF